MPGSTTHRVDLDGAGATDAPISVEIAFDDEYDRAAARLSAEHRSKRDGKDYIHGVEREVFAGVMKTLRTTKERQAYFDHIKQVYLDRCYAACMPAPTDEKNSKSAYRIKTLADGTLKKVAKKPRFATAAQCAVVNRDTYLSLVAERYWFCPWSPTSENATQHPLMRFQYRGYVWEGSDEIAKRTGDATAGLICRSRTFSKTARALCGPCPR